MLKVQHILCPRPVYRTSVMVTHNISFCQSRTASIKLHFLFWKLTKSLTVHDSHIKPVFTAAERKWDRKKSELWERCINSALSYLEQSVWAEMKTCECSRWEAEERTFLIYMLMRETGHQLYRWLVRRLFLCHILSQHKVPIEAVRLLHVLSLIQPFNLLYCLRVCCVCALRMGKF